MGEMAQLVPAGQMNGLTAYNSPTSKKLIQLVKMVKLEKWSNWWEWSK